MELFFEENHEDIFDSWAKTFKQQAIDFNNATKTAMDEGYNEYVLQATLKNALSFMKKFN